MDSMAPNSNQNAQNEGTSGLFNSAAEQNSGEHGFIRNGPIAPAGSVAGYFDNAQDEATGGQGFNNNENGIEEEKTG